MWRCTRLNSAAVAARVVQLACHKCKTLNFTGAMRCCTVRHHKPVSPCTIQVGRYYHQRTSQVSRTANFRVWIQHNTCYVSGVQSNLHYTVNQLWCIESGCCTVPLHAWKQCCERQKLLSQPKQCEAWRGARHCSTRRATCWGMHAALYNTIQHRVQD